MAACRANEEVCQQLHGAERKRETAPLRLQLASSTKAAARSLGEDAPAAGALQALLDRVLAFVEASA